MIQTYIVDSPPFPGNHQTALHRHLTCGEVALLAEDEILELRSDEHLSGPSLLPTPEVVSIEPITWTETLFEPSDILELRAIPPKQLTVEMAPYGSPGRWTRRRHLFYPWANAGAIRHALGDLTAMNAAEGVTTGWSCPTKDRRPRFKRLQGVPLNIYCSANPRSRTGGTSRSDVRLARCVYADLDKTSVDAAVRTWRGTGLPSPTMVVDSGHGAHLYWRLREPILDLAPWTAIQKLLIRALGSDPSIHDPARVMRLPGFLNHNGDPAPATIVEVDPARRYDLGEILAALPTQDPPPVRTQTDEIPVAGRTGVSFTR